MERDDQQRCPAQRAHEKKEAEVVTDADLDIIVQKLLGPPEHVSGALLLIKAHFPASLAPFWLKATLCVCRIYCRG